MGDKQGFLNSNPFKLNKYYAQVKYEQIFTSVSKESTENTPCQQGKHSNVKQKKHKILKSKSIRQAHEL